MTSWLTVPYVKPECEREGYWQMSGVAGYSYWVTYTGLLILGYSYWVTYTGLLILGY